MELAAPPQRWCIITPQYPPLPGPIGDYSWLLAQALADCGDEVDIWVPPGPAAPEIAGVTVHSLPSEYGIDALRVLRRTLLALPAGTRVLVQYAPAAFGMRRVNLLFALLLYQQRQRGIDLYFHDGGYPLRVRQSPQRSIAALVHRVMSWLAVKAARRVFVASPEWQRHLRMLGVNERSRQRVVTWVPVPSNVPEVADDERVRAIRESASSTSDGLIIGHFGGDDSFVQRVLPPAFITLLTDSPAWVALLIGHGGDAIAKMIIAEHIDLADRIITTGHIAPDEVSAHIAACDVLLQPYEHGAGAGHPSLMAALALGRATVSNRGPDTSALWATRHALVLAPSSAPDHLALAVSALLHDAPLRAALGSEARAVYQELFSMSRAVTRLRSRAPVSLPAALSVAQGTPRVLIVLHAALDVTPHPRGAGWNVHHLANALADAGLRVTVASLGSAAGNARYAHHSIPPRSLRHALTFLAGSTLPLHEHDVVHHADAQHLVRGVRRAALPTVYREITGGIGAVDVAEHVAPQESDASPRVVFVGSLHGAGRGRWLYDLFMQHVLPVYPNAELHMVSDVAPPIHPRVRFDPITDHFAFQSAYREAWLCAAPQTDTAAASAALDAMVCGVPVLATPTSASIELLGNGRYGVLADDAVFTDALLRLLSEEGERRRVGVAARARAESLTWPTVAQSFITLYEDAIARAIAEDGSVGILAQSGVGPLAGLTVAVPHSALRVRREVKLWQALAQFLQGAASFVDIHAGEGDATLYALSLEPRTLQRVIAFEPRDECRQVMRHVLAANGYVLDPRLEISAHDVGSESSDEVSTLDDRVAELERPVFVRVATARVLDEVLAGAEQTLAQPQSRWLVAVDRERREQYEQFFRLKGLEPRHLRVSSANGTSHWIAAQRSGV